MAACMLTIGASAQRTCVQDWSRTGNYNSNCAATSSLGTLDNTALKIIQSGVTVMSFTNGVVSPLAVVAGTAQIAVVQATTSTLDFASTASLSASAVLTVAVANAAVTDAVFINAPAAVYSDGSILQGSFNAWVSSAGVVSCAFINASASTKDVASASYRIMVFKN